MPRAARDTATVGKTLQEPTMNKLEHPRRWFTGWRASPGPAEDDPANYGTAFGLDMSLLQPHALPMASVAAKPSPGWIRRLSMRRKPAI